MNRLTLFLAACLLAALGACFLLWKAEGAATLRATSAEASLAQAKARSARVDSASKAADARINKLEQELADALKQNRTWADGRVPPAVTDSLCRELHCTRRTK